MTRAALALFVFVLPAFAQSTDPFHPSAQCAAFWLGRDDYARRSAYLDSDPADAGRAASFRAKAVQLDGNVTDRVDRFIADQRPLMAFLVEAAILGGDSQSRDIHDRLAARCTEADNVAP